jgi:prohibitin 2
MTKRPPSPDLSRVLGEFRKKLGGMGNVGTMPYVVTFFGIAGYTLYSSVYFVPGGFRAVKFHAITGLHQKVFGEGANLAIPFVETPILFDIRSKPLEIASASGSRDLQIINMAVRILYKPNTPQLPEIYRELGVNYADTVLPSIMNEVIKSVIAQFNASEILVKRSEVSSRIAAALRLRSAAFHIDISDVSITQMTFGKEYTAAVENKQVAKQMSERAKFMVDQAVQEKQAAVLLAEGEAESASLIGAAMKGNPAFLELRRVEAARLVAKAVAQGKGNYLLDSNGLMLNMVK